MTDHDPVNHPSHYTSDPSGIECIEITRHLNFDLGNAFKYPFRAGDKRLSHQDEDMAKIEDLEKAVWYLNDEIHNVPFTGILVSPDVLAKIIAVVLSRRGALQRYFECIYMALSTADEVGYHRELSNAYDCLRDYINILKNAA